MRGWFQTSTSLQSNSNEDEMIKTTMISAKNEASEINILKITTELTKRLKPRDSKKYY